MELPTEQSRARFTQIPRLLKVEGCAITTFSDKLPRDLVAFHVFSGKHVRPACALGQSCVPTNCGASPGNELTSRPDSSPTTGVANGVL